MTGLVTPCARALFFAMVSSFSRRPSNVGRPSPAEVTPAEVTLAGRLSTAPDDSVSGESLLPVYLQAGTFVQLILGAVEITIPGTRR